MLIKKQPSPEVNPASHCGSIVFGVSTLGLSTGTTLGKANWSFSDKPRFIDALVATMLYKPSLVRCSHRS